MGDWNANNNGQCLRYARSKSRWPFGPQVKWEKWESTGWQDMGSLGECSTAAQRTRSLWWEQETQCFAYNNQSECDPKLNQPMLAGGAFFAPVQQSSPPNSEAQGDSRWIYASGELTLGLPKSGCTEPMKDIAGKIVLLERGDCTFVEKVLHIQRAGGVAVIIGNIQESNNVFMMGADETGRQVEIPSLMISKSNFYRLKSCLVSARENQGLGLHVEMIEHRLGPSSAASYDLKVSGSLSGQFTITTHSGVTFKVTADGDAYRLGVP